MLDEADVRTVGLSPHWLVYKPQGWWFESWQPQFLATYLSVTGQLDTEPTTLSTHNAAAFPHNFPQGDY